MKKFTAIAYTSDRTGLQKAPLYFNVQKQWTQSDFPMKNLVIAGALEGKLVGETRSKIVVVANGNFPISGERGQKIQPDNVNLLVNSIDWLSDDTGLIGLRTKGVTSRPINQMEDSTKSFLKWINFLLPIILVVGYGFVRFQIKRNERIKRMEDSYV